MGININLCVLEVVVLSTIIMEINVGFMDIVKVTATLTTLKLKKLYHHNLAMPAKRSN
jgi:hypothetical protein